MNIIEVKNNLVKLCYESDLVLSGLILIKDNLKAYIAQIIHLEATRIGKVAVAKILFNYVDKIYAYDGSVPSLRAEIKLLEPSFLLDTIDHSDPLTLGKIAGQKGNLTVDYNILKDNPIVLAEKFYVTKVLLNNLAIQLQGRRNKIVVFDTAGIFKTHKLTITKDFRLPLNSSTINYIYEKGFEDATAESKALIQTIFEELGEYSRTVEFIPFDTFKAVVDAEFMRTKLMQLIIMKNKIKQIRDWNVFAQNSSEFEVLKYKFDTEDTIVLDISCLKPSLQQECIKYVYSVLGDIDAEIFAFTPLVNDSADKFLLSEIKNTDNVHTTFICDYDYPYLDELKKCSKNMLMFTPLKQQKDFGGYNIFLQKLAEDEFIAYGKMTKFVPVIGRLAQLSSHDVFIPAPKEPETPVVPAEPVPVAPVEIVEPVAEPAPAVVPEPVAEPVAEVPVEVPEAVAEPTPAVVEEVPADSTETVDEPAPVVPEEVPAETPEAVAEPAPAVVEEVPAEAPEAVAEPAPAVVEEVPADTPEAVAEPAPAVPEEVPAEAQGGNEVQEALNEVEDVEEDEELSDDDLDMIEKLSKPDEEIPVLNEEVPQPEPVAAEPQPEVVPPAPEPAPQTAPAPEPAPSSVDEEVENAAVPPQQAEVLQTRANTNPAVPEYSADIPEEDKVNSDPVKEGDRVFHQEFGEGVVEKMINYGDKILCSVNFASVGRRLLNPEISEMKKI
ncbi:MAG: hypothetical protein K6E29_05900 [Cyanobacteria bacterium RUI128]|nr:hypothetical protein [Cyanobacteria bacterium RUI128]